MNYREMRMRKLRLTILRYLAEAPGEEDNSSLIQEACKRWGYRVERQVIHQELRHLETLGAVALEKLSDDIILAQLCQIGRNHLERTGPPLEGVDWPTRR